jgi:hypothetical protein
MTEKKNLVEDALLQMKNLEEAVAENAKGILAATMGQEISELVKESLKEQTDDEAELDVDMDMEDEEGDEESADVEMGMDTDNDDVEMDMDMDMTDDMSGMDDMDDETIDLTNASDEEILKVFKAMGEDDGIIVKKDSNSINLKDENEDVEYDIHLGESEDMDTSYEEEDEMWGPYKSTDEESDEDEMMEQSDKDAMMDEEDDEDDMMIEDEDEEEVVYEIEMSDDEEDEMEMEDYSEGMMGEDDSEEMMGEGGSYDYTKSMKAETKEGKMAMKPKGVGMGKAKFSYKSQKGGFEEDMKQGNPKMGTGKAKFEYKEGKKSETKEAARTLGNGKKWGRNGLDKPRTSPRHIQIESNEAKKLQLQVEVLREKNEEYRKALNIFRQKLNEVAVFNSNLAYATRLFTEHSTSKQEKINTLRRFDGVESIKESKNLYKTLKEEFSGKEGKVVTESIENKIDKSPQSGSAANLIESKTYENPQFLRMKDLMSKLK